MIDIFYSFFVSLLLIAIPLVFIKKARNLAILYFALFYIYLFFPSIERVYIDSVSLKLMLTILTFVISFFVFDNYVYRLSKINLRNKLGKLVIEPFFYILENRRSASCAEFGEMMFMVVLISALPLLASRAFPYIDYFIKAVHEHQASLSLYEVESVMFIIRSIEIQFNPDTMIGCLSGGTLAFCALYEYDF